MFLYSIGEFSKITGITIKALRLYHERGLLSPKVVDADTGYRYYCTANIEKARAIVHLKGLMLSLEDIVQLLSDYDDDAELVEFMTQHRARLAAEIHRLTEVTANIDRLIALENEAKKMSSEQVLQIEEKVVPNLLIASIRFIGSYSDCGDVMAKLGKAVGRHAWGKPFNLYYDDSYRETDADIETCIAVRTGSVGKEVKVRELAGGPMLTLVHRGAYTQIGRTYEQLMCHAKSKRLEFTQPPREIYIKGPGMFFRGNPAKYLTEVQLPISAR